MTVERLAADSSHGSVSKTSQTPQSTSNQLAVRPATASNKTSSYQISSTHSEAVQDNPLCSVIK